MEIKKNADGTYTMTVSHDEIGLLYDGIGVLPCGGCRWSFWKDNLMECKKERLCNHIKFGIWKAMICE